MPDIPEGVGRELWYDLSPLRPDEWREQVAGRWRRAEAIQAAYHRGREAADLEHRREQHRQAQATQWLVESKRREAALMKRLGA